MASKGFRVQPLPRVTRHDTVQVCFVLYILYPSHLELLKKILAALFVGWFRYVERCSPHVSSWQLFLFIFSVFFYLLVKFDNIPCIQDLYFIKDAPLIVNTIWTYTYTKRKKIYLVL